MFAVVAFAFFVLEVLNANIGVNLIALGLASVAVHLVFDIRPWVRGESLRA